MAVLVMYAGILTGNLELAGWAVGPFLALLPLAISAAIARYRLYDLDRIISRTQACGLLTVLLGGSYALVVLVLGQLLGPDSPLAWRRCSSLPAAGSSRTSRCQWALRSRDLRLLTMAQVWARMRGEGGE